MTLSNMAVVVRELQPVEDKMALAPLALRINRLDDTLQNMARLAAYAQLRSAGRMGAAPVDDLIAFGQELQHRPRRWLEAARAVDAANSTAFVAFRAAWQAGDERLHDLCAMRTAFVRTPAARKPQVRKPLAGKSRRQQRLDRQIASA